MKNEPRFLVDVMLGRLAKWLRIIGCDAEYANDNNKLNLILRSLKESRVIVTRDHDLSRKRAWKLVLVRGDHVEEQLKQVIREMRIPVYRENFFTRCTVCNTPIEAVVNRDDVKDLVPAYVFETHEKFSRCGSCGKIYWTGTHFDLLLKDLARAGIRVASRPSAP